MSDLRKKLIFGVWLPYIQRQLDLSGQVTKMNFAFKGTPFSPWSRNSRYVIESFKLHHQSVSQSVLLSLVFLSFRRKNMVSVCLVLIRKREDRKTESGAFGRLAQLERALHPLLIQFSPHIPHCSYPHKPG